MQWRSPRRPPGHLRLRRPHAAPVGGGERGLARSGRRQCGEGGGVFPRRPPRHGTLRLWETTRGREIARFNGDFAILAMALVPDGKSLTTSDSGGRVHLVDIIIDATDKAAWFARQ